MARYGIPAFTEGLLEKMKKEADIPAIQARIDKLDLETVNCKVDEYDEYGWWIGKSLWVRNSS